MAESLLVGLAFVS